jgi:hypothetical protein
LAGLIFNPTPANILLNIGVNDLKSALNETAFKTSYLSVIDQLHTKLPLANIFAARVWSSDYTAENLALVNGWIDYCIAQRSTYTFAGPNEPVWLEGGDNGATMTSDGTHYSNPAGITEAAAQWKTVMGY